MAIAATLSLFYIADVLQLESYSGAFLALYFVSGAISLPLWLILTRRLDKTITWMIGSILAVTGFVWAVQLGAGDIVPYAIVCMLSGAALGADLVLPTAIAAGMVALWAWLLVPLTLIRWLFPVTRCWSKPRLTPRTISSAA